MHRWILHHSFRKMCKSARKRRQLSTRNQNGKVYGKRKSGTMESFPPIPLLSEWKCGCLGMASTELVSPFRIVCQRSERRERVCETRRAMTSHPRKEKEEVTQAELLVRREAERELISGGERRERKENRPRGEETYPCLVRIAAFFWWWSRVLGKYDA